MCEVPNMTQDEIITRLNKLVARTVIAQGILISFFESEEIKLFLQLVQRVETPYLPPTPHAISGRLLNQHKESEQEWVNEVESRFVVFLFLLFFCGQ